MTFLIRTSNNPFDMVEPAKKAIAEIDPDKPIGNVRTLESVGVIRDRGYYAFGLGIFAFTSLLLAAIGIYGVTAYSVAQRTREIGIRIALGATARRILYLVGRRALLLIATGLGLGLAGAFAFTQLLSSQLWGVTPTDPLTFVGVCILLVLVAIFACLIPARRAIRVNPTEALRTE
jgi:ABC-type antimicrobial peptide transport system permease subunit